MVGASGRAVAIPPSGRPRRDRQARRASRTAGKDRFAIDEAKVAEDEKFDGVFVLRTNTALDPLAAMVRYKQLWSVEQIFRTTKDVLGTRPIFHKRDETIRGRVFCSFLTPVLKKDLTDRLAAQNAKLEWADIRATSTASRRSSSATGASASSCARH